MNASFYDQGYTGVHKTMDEIVSLMRMRRTADSVLIQAMIENRDRYNGDVITLMPDVSSIPAANRPGPNFFQESLDGLARVANASMPKVNCPVKNPDSPRSEHLAEIRQGAILGAYHETQLQLKLARAYRHLGAYGTMAMVVVADEKLGRADIQLRDPITAYPELRAQDDIRAPSDVGFLYARSSQWIASHYPNAPAYLLRAQGTGWDTLWDVVEWIDANDIVIGVMGPRFPAYGYVDSRPFGYNAIELGRWPNKSGMVPVVIPRRATLDRIMGQLTAMINYSDLYGRMLALEIVATEKAIFPDMVVVSRSGLVPTLVGGKWFDGRTGNVNIVKDGAVELMSKEAGPGTIPVLQMIDQHIRGGTGANGLYGGNAGGMRTGAGVDALGDYGVNPMVAEAQHVMEFSLEEINKGWIATQKGYFGEKKFTVILGLAGSVKTVSYTPDKDFDSDANVVFYPSPGADENKLAVALAQLESTGIMSRKTAREKHPLVDDAFEEEQFVSIEKMTDAALGGYAQEVAQGAKSTAEVARAGQLIAGGMNVFDAMLQAAAETASKGPAPGAPGAPPQLGPNGQPMPPGLTNMLAAQASGPNAAPGEGVPGEQPGLANLRKTMQGINENISPGAV